MISKRLVGLVRISLVVGSLSLVGSAALGSAPVSAGEGTVKSTLVSVIAVPTKLTRVGAPVPSGLQFSSRCGYLTGLAGSASTAGDDKMAHDLRLEAAGIGCIV